MCFKSLGMGAAVSGVDCHVAELVKRVILRRFRCMIKMDDIYLKENV